MSWPMRNGPPSQYTCTKRVRTVFHGGPILTEHRYLGHHLGSLQDQVTQHGKWYPRGKYLIFRGFDALCYGENHS